MTANRLTVQLYKTFLKLRFWLNDVGFPQFSFAEFSRREVAYLINLGRKRLQNLEPGGLVDLLAQLEHRLIQDRHGAQLVLELEL